MSRRGQRHVDSCWLVLMTIILILIISANIWFRCPRCDVVGSLRFDNSSDSTLAQNHSSTSLLCSEHFTTSHVRDDRLTWQHAERPPFDRRPSSLVHSNRQGVCRRPLDPGSTPHNTSQCQSLPPAFTFSTTAYTDETMNSTHIIDMVHVSVV